MRTWPSIATAFLGAFVLPIAGSIAIGASGCSSTSAPSPSGLEVIVSTDRLTAPADFDDIRLQISQQSAAGTWTSLWNTDYAVGAAGGSASLGTTAPDASVGGASAPDASLQQVTLPATFAIFTGKSPDQEVLVTVTALKGGPDGTPVVLRAAQVQAPTGRMATLVMVLSRACVGSVTSTGTPGSYASTCTVTGESCLPTTGSCGSDVIADSSTLPTYSPGESIDAAIANAVEDASSTGDGGSSEGGHGPGDGGPADGGASDSAPPADAAEGGGASCSVANGGCDLNATCTSTGTSVTCTCNADYSGPGTTCMPIDSCNVGHGGCDPNAVCTSVDAGVNTCACSTGYTGDGITCVGTGACAIDNGGCDPAAKCTDVSGTAVCACNAGYAGDGGTCTAIAACATNNGGCDPKALCVDTGPGANTCTCDTGYSGDGGTCAPVDACATNRGGCDPNATCADVDAGVNTCTCNPGYTGTGYSCMEIDSCTMSHGGCDPNATCTSTGPGTNTCACNANYTGDGGTCTGINGCSVQNGGCAAAAACASTGPDTVQCTCNTGYAGDGGICTPIDLCTNGQSGCDPHAQCSMTGPGTAMCTCNTGYTGPGTSCMPIDACAMNRGGCDVNATCQDIDAGLNSCTCNMGYQGNGSSCMAVDPCQTNNGGCGGETCTMTGPGTAKCSCASPTTTCGSSCANLTNDPSNCGACSHSCLGGTCTNGFCTPLGINSTFIATPLGGIGIDATNIYFTTTTGGAIERCPISGCPSEVMPTPVATGFGNAGALYYDGTSTLIVSDSSKNTITALTTAGATKYAIAGENAYVNFATDGTNLYWGSGTGGGIRYANLATGGAASSLPGSGPNNICGIWYDAGSSTVFGADCTNANRIDVCKLGSTCTFVSPTTSLPWSNPSFVLVANATLYVGAGGGGLGGIFTAPVANPGNLAAFDDTNISETEGLVADGTNLYFVDINSSSETIVSCPLGGCNGAPTPLVQSASPEYMLTDSQYLYYESGNSVFRVPK